MTVHLAETGALWTLCTIPIEMDWRPPLEVTDDIHGATCRPCRHEWVLIAWGRPLPPTLKGKLEMTATHGATYSNRTLVITGPDTAEVLRVPVADLNDANRVIAGQGFRRTAGWLMSGGALMASLAVGLQPTGPLDGNQEEGDAK